MVGLLFFTKGEIMASPYIKTTFCFIYVIIPPLHKVPSRVMRKFVCSLWLNEVSRQ